MTPTPKGGGFRADFSVSITTTGAFGFWHAGLEIEIDCPLEAI